MHVSDTMIQWIYEIKQGQYLWPYVGLSRELNESDPHSFSPQDTFVVEMKSNHTGKFVFKISSFEPGRTLPNDPMSCRISELAVTVTPVRQRFTFPLEKFAVPDWWKEQQNVIPEDNRLFLDSICLLQVIGNDKGRINCVDTFEMYSFEIRKYKANTEKSSLWILILVLTITVIAALVLFIWKKRAGKDLVSPGIRELRPQPQVALQSDWNRTLEFIEKNYTDGELSIGKVANVLGFSDSKLSRLISENYPDGFRALVHELRIKEGKRLLGESKMNIAEIAFTLGYATPSHFNREFKKRIGVSPGVFRKGTLESTEKRISP
ncbi:MAG: helix-turn-helix transcriptional regulator [Fibrobacter sp.]|nr:helix-turn-helix transcriptional regulator [Fibrobacter sp.]